MTALAGAIERKARELGVWSEREFWYGDTLPLLTVVERDWYLLQTEAGDRQCGPLVAAVWLMCLAGKSAEVFFAGMLDERAELTVLAEKLMNIGAPLGEVLALWMAGKLEERHVLGVDERVCTSDELDRGPTSNTWRTGWRCLEIVEDKPPGVPSVCRWRRPALVAAA